MKSAILVGLLACATLTAQASEDLCHVTAGLFRVVAEDLATGKATMDTSIAKVRAAAELKFGKCETNNKLFDGFACLYRREAENISRVAGKFGANYKGDGGPDQFVKDMYEIAQTPCRGGRSNWDAPVDEIRNYNLEDGNPFKRQPAQVRAAQPKGWVKNEQALQDYRIAPSAASLISVDSTYIINDRASGGKVVTLTLIESGDISGPEARDVVDIDLSALGSFTGMDDCTMWAKDGATEKRSGAAEAMRMDGRITTSEPKLTSLVKSSKAFGISFECPKVKGSSKYSPANTYSASK